MPQKTWDRGTRWLHWGLSVAVTLQLFASLVMETPQPGLRPQAFGLLAYQAHKAVGVALGIVVVAHWLWSFFSDHGQAIRHLFPWGGAGLKKVVSELKGLKAGTLPEGGPGGGLAGLVHGLGFLAVTGMVVLGGLLLFLSSDASRLSLFRDLGDVHRALANLVWLYWIGHVVMVVVHEWRGHRILVEIFRP